MGLLLSSYFRDNPRFQACLDGEDASIAEGDLGPHVVVIQYAVLVLSGGKIDDVEITNGYFGPTTAQAVLGYNTTRRIAAPTSGVRPVDWVGPATLAQMDREMTPWS